MVKIISDLGKVTLGKTTRDGYLVECKCGYRWTSFKYNVDSGKVKQCKSCARKKPLKHGKTNTRLYSVFKDMKKRCYNNNSKSYAYYGGRGITISDEWLNDFMKFYNWSMENGYSETREIDRINNDSGYSSENCRWVDRSVNCINRRIDFKNNTSGYRGVSYNKNKKKWTARLSVNKSRIEIGLFETAEEAAIAYNDYIVANNLNYPLNQIERSYDVRI